MVIIRLKVTKNQFNNVQGSVMLCIMWKQFVKSITSQNHPNQATNLKTVYFIWFFFALKRVTKAVYCYCQLSFLLFPHLLDQPKLTMQQKDNGSCFITQTFKECKHQFYRKAIEESNNKNLEFFILKREFTYQFMTLFWWRSIEWWYLFRFVM